MAIKKKTTKRAVSKKKKIVLSFNEAVTSLSLLGTLWRTAVAVALFLTLYILNTIFSLVSVQNDVTVYISSYELKTTLLSLLGFGAAVFLIDSLYVTITKRYPLNQLYDKVVLLGLESFFVVAMLIDWATLQAALINNTSYPNYVTDVIMLVYFVVVLLALPLRFFVGVTKDVAMKRK